MVSVVQSNKVTIKFQDPGPSLLTKLTLLAVNNNCYEKIPYCTYSLIFYTFNIDNERTVCRRRPQMKQSRKLPSSTIDY